MRISWFAPPGFTKFYTGRLDLRRGRASGRSLFDI
jgi:hypothetical protein